VEEREADIYGAGTPPPEINKCVKVSSRLHLFPERRSERKFWCESGSKKRERMKKE